jgi:hypothetical protein
MSVETVVELNMFLHASATVTLLVTSFASFVARCSSMIYMCI